MVIDQALRTLLACKIRAIVDLWIKKIFGKRPDVNCTTITSGAQKHTQFLGIITKNMPHSTFISKMGTFLGVIEAVSKVPIKGIASRLHYVLQSDPTMFKCFKLII